MGIEIGIDNGRAHRRDRQNGARIPGAPEGVRAADREGGERDRYICMDRSIDN